MPLKDSSYRGRFAPSPTGPLHFGSLYTAVASYLQARSKNGKWLLRIDDLDPFRCKSEYTTQILNTLEQYKLEWDESVFYQSSRCNAYQQALNRLQQLNLLYPCQCSRKGLAARHVKDGVYDGYCLTHDTNPNTASSLQIRLPNTKLSFFDAVQGQTIQDLKQCVGDFVMFRKDQVYAYHLAVILDDQAQDITEVLRGHDLLDSTYRQIHLQQLLNVPTPNYAHIPVISGLDGAKLSKQTFAEDVSISPPRETLINVFKHLNLNPPSELVSHDLQTILEWGTNNWSLDKVQDLTSIQFKR